MSLRGCLWRVLEAICESANPAAISGGECEAFKGELEGVKELCRRVLELLSLTDYPYFQEA